jgi:hypothetical protein
VSPKNPQSRPAWARTRADSSRKAPRLDTSWFASRVSARRQRNRQCISELIEAIPVRATLGGHGRANRWRERPVWLYQSSPSLSSGMFSPPAKARKYSALLASISACAQVKCQHAPAEIKTNQFTSMDVEGFIEELLP